MDFFKADKIMRSAISFVDINGLIQSQSTEKFLIGTKVLLPDTNGQKTEYNI